MLASALMLVKRDGRVVAQFRQVDSFPLVLFVVATSIAMWPMAFVVGWFDDS